MKANFFLILISILSLLSCQHQRGSAEKKEKDSIAQNENKASAIPPGTVEVSDPTSIPKEFDTLTSNRFLLKVFDTSGVKDQRKMKNEYDGDYDTVIKVDNTYGTCFYFKSKRLGKFFTAYFRINKEGVSKFKITKLLSDSLRQKISSGKENKITLDGGVANMSIDLSIHEGKLNEVQFHQAEAQVDTW